jgi:hypothetical protein
MYSILSGEVKGDDVGIIITRTRAKDFEQLESIVKEYYDWGNPNATGKNLYALGPNATGKNLYALGEFEWEDVLQLAHNLWYSGRIHQPRNFDISIDGYLMPEMQGCIWMEIVPTNTSTNESVVAAYEQYQVLKALAE